MCCLLLLMRNQLHTRPPNPQAETACRMEIPGGLTGCCPCRPNSRCSDISFTVNNMEACGSHPVNKERVDKDVKPKTDSASPQQSGIDAQSWAYLSADQSSPEGLVKTTFPGPSPGTQSQGPR